MPQPRLVRVHGHRGARAVLPENTLAGFRFAIEVGADAIEMDVAVTRDGVPLISHDPWLPGSHRPIRELSFEDLRQRAPDIPTLDEVLALGQLGGFLFNLEIKSYPEHPELSPAPGPFAELVLEAVGRFGMAQRAMVQSFDFRILHAAKALAPEIPRGALFERAAQDFAEVVCRAQASIAVPRHNLVTPQKVAEAHQEGVEVYVWTVNSRSGWRRQIESCVDAIITDDPDGLIRFLERPS